MGGAFSRHRSESEEENSTAFKYPAKAGNYFSRYFFMGGSVFETIQPEAFLFGDPSDLNFLSSQPAHFPYEITYDNEPTRALRALVNVRKDSVRLVRNYATAQRDYAARGTEPSCSKAKVNDSEACSTSNLFNLEFTFDCDVRCAITIYYCAREHFRNGELSYTPKNGLKSETFHYERGINQLFSQPSHVLDASNIDTPLDPRADVYPIVIHCVVDNATYAGHSHVTLCSLERPSQAVSSDAVSATSSSHDMRKGGASSGPASSAPGPSVPAACAVKVVKQKQAIDGLLYVLSEIYGIENKISRQIQAVRNGESVTLENGEDDEGDTLGELGVSETGMECVVCMCEPRDTLILPCRHLCLCAACGENLRNQAANCPICRAPFRALLQIQALRRRAPRGTSRMLTPSILVNVNVNVNMNLPDHSGTDPIGPEGYEVVSLVEALNGLSCPAAGAQRDSLVRRARPSAAAALHREPSLRTSVPPPVACKSHVQLEPAAGANINSLQCDAPIMNNINDDEEDEEEEEDEEDERRHGPALMNIHPNLDTLPKSSVPQPVDVDNDENDNDNEDNDNENDIESVTTECSELATIAASLAREQAGPGLSAGPGMSGGPGVSVVYVQKPKAAAAGLSQPKLRPDPDSPPTAAWSAPRPGLHGHAMPGPQPRTGYRPGPPPTGYQHYPQAAAGPGAAGPQTQRPVFTSVPDAPAEPAECACHAPIMAAPHVHHAHQITTTCFSTSTTLQHGHVAAVGPTVGTQAVSHTRTTTMSVFNVGGGVGVVQHTAVAVQHTSVVQHFETAYPVAVPVGVGVGVASHPHAQPDDAQLRGRARHSMDASSYIPPPGSRPAAHGHPHMHGHHGHGHGHARAKTTNATSSSQQARMTKSMHETRHDRIHEVSDEDNENETIEMRCFGDEHDSDELQENGD